MRSAAVTSRGFHTHAKEFFDAAEAVYSTRKPPRLPLAFLWGRCIELLLKSYLLSMGLSVNELRSRPYGHNLEALFKAAVERNIQSLVGTDPMISSIMQLLNTEYGSKRLEYRESGTIYSLPEPDLARQVIRRLLKGVNYHLEQNST